MGAYTRSEWNEWSLGFRDPGQLLGSFPLAPQEGIGSLYPPSCVAGAAGTPELCRGRCKWEHLEPGLLGLFQLRRAGA